MILARDERGASVIEFAVAAPVLILLLIGIYDMAHTAYLTSVLNGAMQEAARSDGLETADEARADAFVSGIVKTVAPGADLKFKRRSYYDFADIKRPEAWNDKNANGKCDNGETFTDENRSGKWEDDVGTLTNGTANDVVLYTVEVTYQPPFINPFMGPTAGNFRKMYASAIRKNQPFKLQEKYGSAAGTCP